MKVVNLEKLWNFVVDNFFIWIRLGPQTSIYTRFRIICGERKWNIDTNNSVVQWLQEGERESKVVGAWLQEGVRESKVAGASPD
jgi:hypothetical protein